jgi:hypothetical protein
MPALPYSSIDPLEVRTRNDNARHIVAGFAAATPPTMAGIWQHLETALSDVAAALAEITRLSAGLERIRLDRANLLAAMRATLAAQADGEPDPMWYLRDALDAPETPAAASRRSR